MLKSYIHVHATLYPLNDHLIAVVYMRACPILRQVLKATMPIAMRHFLFQEKFVQVHRCLTLQGQTSL